MATHHAISGTELAEETVAAFKTTLRGELLRPGDNGYDAARTIWNAMINKRPALIARCAGVADVINAVNFARTHDLLVAVRGGGHNVDDVGNPGTAGNESRALVDHGVPDRACCVVAVVTGAQQF